MSYNNKQLEIITQKSMQIREKSNELSAMRVATSDTNVAVELRVGAKTITISDETRFSILAIAEKDISEDLDIEIGKLAELQAYNC